MHSYLGYIDVLRKKSMISQAAIQGCSRRHGVSESTCMTPLAVLFTIRDVPDIGCIVMALVTRTTCFCFSVSTSNTLPSVTFAVLAVLLLSTITVCPTGLSPGCKLYRTIFLSAGKITFTDLSTNDDP